MKVQIKKNCLLFQLIWASMENDPVELKKYDFTQFAT